MDKSEIRKDYFLDKYVIIAPKRAKRPQKVEKTNETNDNCYFCPEKLSPEETIVDRVNDAHGNWSILTIENKFPALSTDNPRAFGKQEVVIENPKHGVEINEMSIEHILEILDVYIERYRELEELKGIKYTLVFKNEGGKAGASICHSHSQIIALPLVPPTVKEESIAYSKYRFEKGTCPYCDVILKEKESSRMIYEDEHIFVLAPFASDSPYGAWFLPKRHIKSMLELNESEKRSLAKALKETLDVLDDLDIAYNYFFHNAVSGEDYHMHLKLAPRPNIWAGLELGTGVIINPIPPEFAAKLYRGEIKMEDAEDKKHIKVSM